MKIKVYMDLSGGCKYEEEMVDKQLDNIGDLHGF